MGWINSFTNLQIGDCYKDNMGHTYTYLGVVSSNFPGGSISGWTNAFSAITSPSNSYNPFDQSQGTSANLTYQGNNVCG